MLKLALPEFIMQNGCTVWIILIQNDNDVSRFTCIDFCCLAVSLLFLKKLKLSSFDIKYDTMVETNALYVYFPFFHFKFNNKHLLISSSGQSPLLVLGRDTELRSNCYLLVFCAFMEHSDRCTYIGGAEYHFGWKE